MKKNEYKLSKEARQYFLAEREVELMSYWVPIQHYLKDTYGFDLDKLIRDKDPVLEITNPEKVKDYVPLEITNPEKVRNFGGLELEITNPEKLK